MPDRKDAELIAELRAKYDAMMHCRTGCGVTRAGDFVNSPEIEAFERVAYKHFDRLLSLAESARTARADALREAAEIARAYGDSISPPWPYAGVKSPPPSSPASRRRTMPDPKDTEYVCEECDGSGLVNCECPHCGDDHMFLCECPAGQAKRIQENPDE